MKSFIRYFSLFFFIPLAVISSTYLIKYTLTNNKLKEIGSKYTLLVMGDSHMSRINHDLIGVDTYNLATPGEHYFYTYSKLRSVLENEDCKVKSIIIGISPINFSPSLQKIFDLKNIEGKTTLKKSLYFIDLFDSNEYSLYDYLSSNYFYIGVFWPIDWGGFVLSNYSNPTNKEINNALDIHYNTRNLNTLSVQEKYLEKIVELCKFRGIRLIAVATPVPVYYKSLVPKKYIETFKKVISKYKDECIFVNYYDVQLSDSCFSDADHLNVRGGEFMITKIDSALRYTR